MHEHTEDPTQEQIWLSQSALPCDRKRKKKHHEEVSISSCTEFQVRNWLTFFVVVNEIFLNT